MSHDIIKSLNKINISVNENDQVLWECQASAKSYNEAIIKLREECDRLNREVVKIEEEIDEIEPQIKVLAISYDIQIESLPLNQQSLINQRIYKKCLKERINEYQDKEEKIIEDYTQYIQNCKEKLEFSNPTYKLLQTKRVELKQRKIHCMDLQYKIIELRNINKQKLDIKQKLFYNCIIQFVQQWVNKRRFLEMMSRLKEDTKREREYMQKLTEVTEQLKNKQLSRYLPNRTTNFKFPQMEFPANIADNNNSTKLYEKGKSQITNCFDDIKTMLENRDVDLKSKLKKSDCPKPKFSNDNSKVKILQNTTLKSSQEPKTPSMFKSKDERNKEIAIKIQKVVQNFNKNVSRQNSKRNVILPEKSQTDKKLDRPQVPFNTETDQNSQKNLYEGSGATQAIQNLKLTMEETNNSEFNFFDQQSDRKPLQLSNKQFSYFNKNKTCSVQSQVKENCGNRSLHNANISSSRLPNTNKTDESIENMTGGTNKISQTTKNLDKSQTDFPGGKSGFMMPISGFSTAFGGMGDNNLASFLRPSDLGIRNENLTFDNNMSLDTPGFFMDGSDDYEATFKSPEFNPNYNLPTEESSAGMGNLFSFGQSGNLFSFK